MSLKHAALGLLSRGPASGYDLLQTFHGSLANVWPATQSQLYGELGQLAQTRLAEGAARGVRAARGGRGRAAALAGRRRAGAGAAQRHVVAGLLLQRSRTGSDR